MLQLICSHRVFEKHRDGHGSHAAGNGCDVGALGGDFGKVHIAAEFAVFVAVHAHIDNHRAFAHHVRFQELGAPYRNANYVRAAGDVAELARPAVTDCDGCVAVEEKLRKRLAHKVGAPHHDGVSALEGDGIKSSSFITP